MSSTIGLLAGMVTTGAWLPQILQCWRRRSCEDIAWAYLMAMVVGFTTWLSYGLLIGEVAVVATNILSLLLALVLTLIKLTSPSLDRASPAPACASPAGCWLVPKRQLGVDD